MFFVFAMLLGNKHADTHHTQVFVIDKIEAVVFGDDDTKVITQSDIERPGIDGSLRSRDDLVLEQLMYDDAKRYKIVPDQEKIDKHLQTVQREHNLTHEQMEQIFDAAGYSFEEGKNQFARMTTVNSVVDFKVKSRSMTVSEASIKKYYDEHPQWKQAAYELQRGVVLADPDTSPEQLKQLIKRGVKRIEWSASFWIEESNVAEEKNFIKTMKINDIRGPFKTEAGFEFFKLINKRDKELVSLEERSDEIMYELRKKQFQDALEKYVQELKDASAVVYFD